jgi:sugar phosphate isomerase/epimerase
MHSLSRRDFLAASATLSATAILGHPRFAFAADAPGAKMKLGLVTYLWGQHMDLPTLISACETSKVLGVELRVDHAHNVSPKLSADERAEVRKRFEDSPVVCVGMGTNQEYHQPSERAVARSIEQTGEYLKLSHDIGATGVKVKPNNFVEGEEHAVTIERIGKALKKCGEMAADYGQEIRLEVHGQCSELPTIKAIMDVADHPLVKVCWNSNDQDLEGDGLVHNFNLVKDRFGATAHVRELNIGDYPYQDLIKLFVDMDYDGWILLEARTDPEDKVAALIEQREVFEQMVKQAQA